MSIKEGASMMLTKDQLKYRIVKNQVKPQFISCADREIMNLCTDVCQLIIQSQGKTESELDEQLLSLASSNHPLFPGIKKVSSFFYTQDDALNAGEKELQRNNWLLEAQRLRQEKYFSSYYEYQETFANLLTSKVDVLMDELYCDLPQYRKILSIKKFSAEDIVDKYNCSLVQGLLLKSSEVNLEIFNPTTSEMRYIFRFIKFQRLLVDVKNKSQSIQLKISGPLSIIENMKAYSMRIASFFPRILHLENWQLSAEIEIKNKIRQFSISNKDNLKNYNPIQLSYIPKELTEVLNSYNQKTQEWKTGVGDEFVHLGNQSYCFPDFFVINRNGQKIHIELFHRWHHSQLVQRLNALEKNQECKLLLGVCRSIAKKDKIKEYLNSKSCFQKRGFVFSDYPTIKVISAALKTANFS